MENWLNSEKAKAFMRGLKVCEFHNHYEIIITIILIEMIIVFINISFRSSFTEILALTI